MTQPQGLALRALPALLYGTSHPYGKPFTGSGDPGGRALADPRRAGPLPPDLDPAGQRHDLRGRRSAARPARAAARGAVRQLAGARRRSPAASRRSTSPTPAPRPRIILINRPQSPQSVILGAQILPAEGTQDLLNLTAANEALGGNFLSRINMELRERRGWSYGARGGAAAGRASGALHHHRPGPGRPDRPVDRRGAGDGVAAS